MRILLTGASGFIGGALARALLTRGHELVCVVRHPARLALGPGPWRALQADFSEPPPARWWRRELAGIDAVVNAVGILREQRGQRFEELHTRGPVALFQACADAGVGRVVQISALGADAGARSGYHRSKTAADDALRALPLRAAIVQPSLVYGPGGASAALFNTLAAAPLLVLPQHGAMAVQPVHLDDLVAGVLALLEDAGDAPEGTVALAAPPGGEQPRARARTIAFVGPQRLSLRGYLGQLRAGLGLARAQPVIGLPAPLFRAGAALAAKLPGSFLDLDTADMLLRGNAAPADDFTRLLGRPPRAPAQFIEPAQAAALRQQALLALWLPLLRTALAALWIWTAAVSFGLYPVQDSYALLAAVGLTGAVATLALYGAAALDLALGLLTLWAPARWRGAVWAAQLLLIGGYTGLITLFLPHYWLHPYGPISKNLPIMAAIALLWALEPPVRKDRGG